MVADTQRRIQPVRKRISVRSIPGYFPVILVVAKRDYTAKYKQSLLGPAWLVILPAALLAGLIVGFRTALHAPTGHTPYVLFALTGLMVWTFVQAALTMGTVSLISNTVLVKRTSAPRLVFPFSSILATLPTLAVTALAAIFASALYGEMTYRAVFVPLSMVWLLALTFGLITLSSAAAVAFRDVINLIPFGLQLGIFFAPVGYALSSVSERVANALALNPVTGIIEFTRWSLLSGDAPTRWEVVGISGAVTVLVIVAGWQVFARLEPLMAAII